MTYIKFSTFALLISVVLSLVVADRLNAESTVPATVNRLSLDFEGLHDLEVVTVQFANIGVFFDGATVIGQRESLNYLNFPHTLVSM